MLGLSCIHLLLPQSIASDYSRDQTPVHTTFVPLLNVTGCSSDGWCLPNRRLQNQRSMLAPARFNDQGTSSVMLLPLNGPHPVKPRKIRDDHTPHPTSPLPPSQTHPFPRCSNKLIPAAAPSDSRPGRTNPSGSSRTTIFSPTASSLDSPTQRSTDKTNHRHKEQPTHLERI